MQPNPESIFPEDDETVLVCHHPLHKDPVRAFFDKEDQCFYPIDDTTFPMLVTHWMKMPQFNLEDPSS